MLRLKSLLQASMTRRLYWFLGFSTLLFIIAMIGTYAPNDLRFHAIPDSKAIPGTSTPQSIVSHIEPTHKVTERQRTWNDSLSGRPTSVGIYFLLDHSSLQNGNAEVRWQNLNDSISSTCRAVHRLCIRILINKKDSQTTDIRQFVARYFNTGSVLCKELGATTDFRTVEVGDLRKSAQTLNQIMSNDYVTESTAYFSIVIFPNTDYRSMPDQFRMLREKSSDEVGLIVDYAGSSTLPSSVFFSRIHSEIFGWFLPPFLADVELAVTYTFQLYPAHLVFTVWNESVNSSSVDVTRKSPALTSSGLSSLTLDRDTLSRYISVSRASACFRCPNRTSHRVISMSLYGANGRYTMGAIRNAQLLPITFPGWSLRFYVELHHPGRPYKYGQVPQTVLSKLVALGAEIRFIDVIATGLAPMLWRFTVAEDPDVDVFIVRDSDSRLTPRDATVVADWLKTDKVFHCVRDHPSHSRFPVSGGLWGARRKPFLALFGEGRLLDAMHRYGAGYVQDMNFLGREVWPKVTQVAYCHDSFSCERYAASHPFPVARIGTEHLGQVYDAFSMGRKSDMDTISRTPVNTKCVVVVQNSSRLPHRGPG